MITPRQERGLPRALGWPRPGLSVLVAVVQLQHVQARIRAFDAGIRVMRVPEAQPAALVQMRAHADVVAKLEGRADGLVGETRARERIGAHAGFEVVTIRPSPAQQRRGAELPYAVGISRTRGMPIGHTQFTEQVKAAAAFETV